MFGLYYRALMASELPEAIDCRQLAAGTGVLSGTLEAARLMRIAEPYRMTGAAQIDLRCTDRDGGGYSLHGRIVAPMEAHCQRCLEWTAWPVEVAFEVMALTKAPPAQEHDEADSIELVDGMLPLRELIEDELLLSCPFAPLHARAECSAGGDNPQAEVASDRRQPFADLATLLKSREHE